ncbi:MAG: tRNA preQ1(34) S-adenosylmethionine ribosyltransferase-isomerase QueA, partial [Candidatus Aegiribacteria sp.]|nr:tRNA preQ1(34) S-adenosylmethionine ribosyltransferase-isomerase QueA [Candidatus Aegiribacteria sp.]MBD3295109.1 tRNA preQ1(34) S-adenosylmethionine ribosyltransferase-isomerase QueA [Candidatus Fermentibacteria bacterium]
ERYQTVFASKKGAVAAPTAGLHFTEGLLEELEEKGIGNVTLTLHVGPGTFQPLRENRLESNELEPEEYEIGESALAEIRRTRNRGGRVVAVGTTSTRVLETVDPNSTETLTGETGLFIFPPYRFKNVDALITNFHLPESSLLCLVAAFMGYDFMMEVYRHAVAEAYRFYSYGDAMLIERGADT